MIPQATTENIKRARYKEKDGKFYVEISVAKDGASGVVRFGWFDTKIEAKEFFKQLKSN